MNRSVFDTEAPSPWKNRASIPYPRQGVVLLLALLHVVASLTFVFFFLGDEYASMIAFTVLCAGALLVVRMPRGTVGLLITAILPVILLRSFSVGALVLAIVVGTASGTMLLTSTRKPWQTAALPAIAWMVAYAITKTPTVASLALLLLPAVLLLTYATVTDQRRCTAICYAIIGYLIPILIIFYLCVSKAYGAFDRNILHTFFEDSRTWCVDLLMQAKDVAIRTVESQMNAESTELINQINQTLTRENLVTMVAMIYNVLPAIIVAGCGVLAFEAQSMLCGMYYTNGMKEVLTPNATAFTMSVISAALYVFSFVVLMFASDNSMFFAVVRNCYIILTPGLFLVGWASTRAQFRASRGGSRIITIVLAIFVLTFSGFGALISLLAFVGAVMILLSYLGFLMIKRMQERMGDNLPPDFEAWKRNFEQNARRNSYSSRNFEPDTPEEEPEEEPQEEAQEEAQDPEEPKEEADGDDEEPRDGNP